MFLLFFVCLSPSGCQCNHFSDLHIIILESGAGWETLGGENSPSRQPSCARITPLELLRKLWVILGSS